MSKKIEKKPVVLKKKNVPAVKEEPKPKQEPCPADACQILQDTWESGGGAYNAMSKYCKACEKDFPKVKAICEARTTEQKKKVVEKKASKGTGRKMVKVGYGHKEGTQAAYLDSCFMKGMTMEQLIKGINDNGLNMYEREDSILRSRIFRHIDDLKRDHGIIVKADSKGVYKGEKA
jgi:hypothetical protein